MNILIVYAHPEPDSFNGAMKDLAVATLTGAGHQVTVSDLYAQSFNPVAGSGDFTARADPARLDMGAEQAHAARTAGFAPDLQREIRNGSVPEVLSYPESVRFGRGAPRPART